VIASKINISNHKEFCTTIKYELFSRKFQRLYKFKLLYFDNLFLFKAKASN